MLHGVWIAVFALLLAALVEMIPLAALGGLLVVVGAKLVNPGDVRAGRHHGELVVHLGTVAGVLALNLREGVAIGLARTLATVPPGARVHLELRVDYLDHAARDHISSWATRHRAGGGSVEVRETRRQGRRAARRAGGSLAPLPPTVHRERRPAPAR